jgi:hypothetical protein
VAGPEYRPRADNSPVMSEIYSVARYTVNMSNRSAISEVLRHRNVTLHWIKWLRQLETFKYT